MRNKNITIVFRIILFGLFLLTRIDLLYSQTPVINWQRTIGGIAEESPFIIKATVDSGLIMAGFSYSGISGEKTDSSRGESDYWIVKLRSNGSIEWQKTIGGSEIDGCYSIFQLADKGYIVGGLSYSSISGEKTDTTFGGSDYWILKLDSLGSIIWQASYGGNYPDELVEINQTVDGGFILGGTSMSDNNGIKTDTCRGGSDYWVIKIDSLGIIQWQKTIGGADLDVLTSLKQTFDKGYIIGGYSYSNNSGDKTENSRGATDIWVVKLDSIGDITWQRTIGGNDFDLMNSLQLLSTGNYILAGSSYSNISGEKTQNSRGGDDFWILKLDPLGNIVWQQTIGGDMNDWANSIDQTPDGKFIVIGTSGSGISGDKSEFCRGGKDYWLIKIDSVGNIIWQKTLGGTDLEEGYSLVSLNSSEFAIAGFSASNIGFDKTENSRGLSDWWILSFSEVVGIDEITPIINTPIYFPNPAKDEITINNLPNSWQGQVNVVDLFGRLLYSVSINSGVTFYKCDISKLNSGIYIIKMQINGIEYSLNFIKE